MSDVTITFGGDATQLNQALNEIKQTVNSVFSQVKQQVVSNTGEIKNSFNNISQDTNSTIVSMKQFGIGVASVFTAVVGAAKGASTSISFLKGAIDEAAYIETITLNYEQFCGTLEKAQRLIDKLRYMSVKTPYDTKDLLDAGNLLLSAGLEAERVYGIIESLGAVAGGSAQAMNELALALSKGFARQRFQTEQIGSFTRRGINLMPELAAVTNKTGDELRKAIEKGLGFDEVTEAISRLTREGGQYFGLMEKQAGSWNGLVSTLGGVWNELQTELGQPIKDVLTPYLIKSIATLENLLPLAKSVGSAFASGFTTAVNAVSTLVGGFNYLIEGNDMLAVAIRDTIALFVLWKTGAIKGIMDLAHTISLKLGGSLAAVQLQAAVMGGRFATVRAAVSLSFGAMAASARTAFASMVAAAKAAAIGIKTALTTTLVGAAFVVVGEALGYIYKKFMDIARSAEEVMERSNKSGKEVFKLEREIEDISSQTDFDDMEKRLGDKIEELYEERSKAYFAEDTALADQINSEIKNYQWLVNILHDVAPARIRAAEAAKKEKEELERLAEEQEKIEAKQRDNAKTAQEELKRFDQSQARKMYESLGLNDQERGIYDFTGLSNLQEIENRISAIRSQVTATEMLSDAEKAELELLVKSKEALDEIYKKRLELNSAKEAEAASYKARMAILDAEIAGEKEKLKSLKEQQRVLELSDKYKKAGFTEEEARRMATGEASRERLRDIKPEEKPSTDRMNTSFVDSKAAVGGGGGSFIVSVQPLLSESRKQSNLLGSIRQILANQKQGNGQIANVAIIGA